nr:MarR family transcriptional regulator [Rothia sp. ZJ1223]
MNDDERDAWLFLSSVIFNLPGSLEAQLERDADLSFVEYMVLAMLSEAPEHRLTMTELAHQTNTLLPRLSRVVTRLEKQDYVSRTVWSKDRRVSICELHPAGLQKVQEAAPGHVEEVRRQIFNRINKRQATQLAKIGEAVLGGKPSEIITVKKSVIED